MTSIKLQNLSKLTYQHLNMRYLSFLQYSLSQPNNQYALVKHISTSTIFNAQGLPINMPSLSPTMSEGTIVKWMKKEGDVVQPGDVLCDIQTDKAVISLETDEEGILAKILEGDNSKDVKVGTLIALMVEEGEDWKNVEMPTIDKASESKQTASDSTKEKVSTDESQAPSTNFGPSVRLLLEKYGLSASRVPAEGPHGKLLKGDVLRFIKGNNIQPLPISTVEAPVSSSPVQKEAASQRPPVANIISGDQYDDIELTNMRKVIAKRLTQSKSTIAHTYSTLECSMDKLLKLRKQFKADGISVSVNDFVIKAVASALNRCPDINCIWQAGQLVKKEEVDICVAVATDAGLITPIVKGADNLGLEGISSKVRDLATRAKANKLKLDEFQGGTFTISNLGMFGIKEFTAIINPPQCGILAVGGSRIELNEHGAPETRMRATLSYDQAAISDDAAAQFLEILKNILEDPQQMLLGSYNKSFNHPMAALL